MMRCGILSVLAAALSLVPTHARAATDDVVIPFAIEDQFGVVHTDEELRDRVVVVLASDRKGSTFAGPWMRALRDAVAERRSAVAARSPASVTAGETAASPATSDGHAPIRFVEVADLRGVPFFVKGMVRRKFPRDPDRPVLLDWDGSLANAHGFEPDACTILVLDRRGHVERHSAHHDVDPATVREIASEIVRLAEERGHSAFP